MKNPGTMQQVFSADTLKLLSAPLAISAVLFGAPMIISGVNSYLFFLVPLVLSVIFFYIIDSIGEFESAFSQSQGGIYEYFKQSYNRYVGYITAFLVFFAGGFIVSHWLFVSISALSPLGLYANCILTASVIVLLHLAVYRNGRYVTYPSYALAAMLVLGVVYLAFISILNYQVTLPVVTVDEGIFTIVFYLLLTLALYVLPLSFFISETKDAEEEVSDIVKYRKIGYVVGPTLLVLVLMGLKQQVGQLGNVLQSTLLYGSIGEELSSLPWLFKLIPLFGAILLGLLWFYALSRLIHRLAVDELFITRFQSIHGVYHSPYRALMLQTILLVAITFLNIFEQGLLFNLSATVLVIVVCALIPAVFITHLRFPDMERPYSVKHWKGPSILLAGALLLMGIYWLVQHPSGSILLVYITAVALLLFIPYILFELYFNERVLGKAGDLFAGLDKWCGIRKWTLPDRLVEELLGKMGELKGKTVLDFGCKTGKVTMRLIEEVGREGKVYATDKSSKALEVLRAKMDRQGFLSLGFKVHILQDFSSCVNPAIASVSHIISCGTIAGVRNVDHVLKEMNTLMPVSGHIVMMEYDKLLGFFPNKWLSRDEQIKDFFDRNGFGVSVERKRRLLFEHVIITGIKFKDAFYLDTWYTRKDGQGEN